MRRAVPILLLVITPAALPGQTRSERPPAPVPLTLTGDLAAAVEDRWTVALEAVALGRWTVGLRGSYTRERELDCYTYGYGGPYLDYCGPVPLRGVEEQTASSAGIPCMADRPCVVMSIPCYVGQPCGDIPGYRAWSFDLALRYYPAILSLAGPRQNLGVYLGEFIGFHRRRLTYEVVYAPPCYDCVRPLADSTGIISRLDTIIPPPDSLPYPYPQPSYVQRVRDMLEGFEPGVEVGVRLMPSRHVVMDVGGRWVLVRVDDPTRRRRPGDVDPALVVSIGISW